jgi:hypothetical protein
MTNSGVGGDHEGFDHPSGFVGPLHLNTESVLAVKPRPQLGVVEVESNFTLLPNLC